MPLAPLMPFHRVNIMTGTKIASLVEDPKEYGRIIKKSERPLLLLGPKLLSIKLGDKFLLDYALEIASAKNIPMCATSHVVSKLRERGVKPDSEYDIMEIINALKRPEWKGVRGEGNHDLVIFFGFRTDIGEQGLSTLKHFAPHLKTMTLCKYFYPNADYSLPNIRKDEKWKEFLEGLIQNLKE